MPSTKRVLLAIAVSTLVAVALSLMLPCSNHKREAFLHKRHSAAVAAAAASTHDNQLRLQQQPQQNLNASTVLVLDLDETLVHALPPDYTVVVERPHVREFLAAVAASFAEVVVFTAGTREYASPIIDRLDPGGDLIARRFYRDACTPMEDGTLAKDMRLVDADVSRVRIVDNTPAAYALQPQCGIAIPSFMGDDADDDALLQLLRHFSI